MCVPGERLPLGYDGTSMCVWQRLIVRTPLS